MVTVSTLFILMYVYTLYRLRTDSGSWEDFDPMNSGIYHWMVFIIGTSSLIITMLIILNYLMSHNIIP